MAEDTLELNMDALRRVPSEDAVRDPTESSVTEIGLMRQLRSEAQSLLHVLAGIKHGEYGLEDQTHYLVKTHADLTRICGKLIHCNHKREYRSDSIASLINHWEQADKQLAAVIDLSRAGTSETETPSDATTRRLLRRLSHIEAAMTFIVDMTVERTSSERINRWIARNEAGDIISFHRIFEDELPDVDGRKRILGLLASKPRSIRNGILDPVTGLIYCCPTSKASRGLRIVLVLAAGLSCMGGMWACARLGVSSEGVDPTLMIQSWLVMLVGMMSQHLFSRRKAKDPGVADYWLPIARWPRYVAARAGTLIIVIYSSVMAYALYTFAIMDASLPPQVHEAFLLGYGFDSLLEFVSAEMDRRSAKRGR